LFFVAYVGFLLPKRSLSRLENNSIFLVTSALLLNEFNQQPL